MKSYVAKPQEIQRRWLVLDAADQILGRIATTVAMRLRGKHKPIYTPFIDTGDFVIIINAEKVRLTGRKLDDKLYIHHTGFPGGLRTTTARNILEGKFPERVLENAIRGMLPKNVMGRQMYRKLKVYRGGEHPHEAQKPEPLSLD
ncbi:MAG: 50S ribosomal protein L13 [Magnetococcales bacterium]|nr:50S ribosomal protein L13 [Magnetococcales bacterium]